MLQSKTLSMPFNQKVCYKCVFYFRGRCWWKFQTAMQTVDAPSVHAVCACTLYRHTNLTNRLFFWSLFSSNCYLLHTHDPTQICVMTPCWLCAFTERAEVCLFQGVTVLGPGQSLVQYFKGELCYTVHCLHRKDPDTGFYAMQISSVNCSQKCGPVCIWQINILFIAPREWFMSVSATSFTFVLACSF